MQALSSTELTKQAIALRKAGDTPGAVQLLVQAINTTPNFEAAWLWLAACLSVPAEQRYCLEQALNANAENQRARVALARFEHFPSLRPAAFGAEVIAALPEIAPLATVAELEPTKPCPYCAEIIGAAAVVCRFCGQDLNAAITADAPVAATPLAQPVKQKIHPLLMIALLVVVGCGLLWVIGAANRSSGGATTVDTEPDSISAFEICKQFVTDRLTAPSEFPPAAADGVSIARLDSSQFRVNAYVDSENSFGRYIRRRYNCTVHYIGNNNWRLEKLTTDP